MIIHFWIVFQVLSLPVHVEKVKIGHSIFTPKVKFFSVYFTSNRQLNDLDERIFMKNEFISFHERSSRDSLQTICEI